jgi:type I restriction enzyme, S subunit
LSLQTFFENFALLANTPRGVQNLRKLILHLAVRGRLGTQHPSDTAAKYLVETIKNQKEKTFKNFKAGKGSLSDTIPEDEKFCDVPSQWTWIRLNDLGRFTGGATPSTNNALYWNGDVLWVSPKDMKNGRVYESELKITQKALEETRLEVIPPQSILIVARSGILKRLLPVAINEIECTVNQDLKVVIPFVQGVSDYVQLMLKGFEEFILTQLVKGGMTVQSLKYSEFEHQAFPLPPIEEQKRIVVKVNELMQLCDDFEAKQHAKRDSRVRLNMAVLAPLNEAAKLKAEEFEQAGAHLTEHFDTLYESVETVSKLRATILQLAVQGKLVEQRPCDEPAFVLLRDIKHEKEKQILDGKSRQLEPLHPITEDDRLDMRTPKGWAWSWLGDLARFIDYRGRTPAKTDKGVKLITAKNVRMGFISELPREFISEKTYSQVMTRGFPKFGDILFTTEAPLGNVAQLLTHERVALAQRVIDLQTFKPLCAEYLKLCLMSPLVQQAILERATGMTATGIKASKLKLIPVPVPPLEEQRRIVAKINQLMALCDAFESKLRETEAHSEKLMNAAVQHVIQTVSSVTPSRNTVVFRS